MAEISIITPMYNAERTITETINSVINQTFSDWEMIIVDDKSTDNSVKIVEAFKNGRIKLITSEFKLGVASARNKAISNASGNFITFLDSDDIWHHEKLERQYNFMVENNIAFSYGDYFTFTENIENHTGEYNTRNIVTYDKLCLSCDIGCLTVMLDHRAIKNIYFPNIPKEDYAAWILILKNNIIAHKYPGKLAYYRLSKKSLSGNKLKELKKQYIVLRKIAKLPFIITLRNLIHYSINGFIKHYINYKSK